MPEPRYDLVAASYDDGADDYSNSATSSLLQLVGPVAGLRVVDVACGPGLIAREMARRGARVMGVDISGGLLARARESESALPLGIQYVEADITVATALAGEHFDVAACNFGLSDIDDLDAACASVARVVETGGAFVFSILHPCFPGVQDVSASWPTGGRYYDEGLWFSEDKRSRLRQQVGANHRTVSTYVNTLARHGFVLALMAEPPPNESWLEDRPGAERLPVYLVARCRRV